MSGEKTIQAEPLLEAKIVSIVSTSLLRGVEAQQHRAKSAPSGNLSMARAIWGRRVRYSLGVRIAVRGQRPMRQLVASWEYSKVTLEEGRDLAAGDGHPPGARPWRSDGPVLVIHSGHRHLLA